MAVILAASNFLVQFPVNDWFTFGALTYPLAFLVVDLANRGYGAGLARRVVAVGFVFGAPLSFVFAAANPAGHTPPDDVLLVAARIAGASGAAFLAAQLLDVAIFDRLRNAADLVERAFCFVRGRVRGRHLFVFRPRVFCDRRCVVDSGGGRFNRQRADDFRAAAAVSIRRRPRFRGGLTG